MMIIFLLIVLIVLMLACGSNYSKQSSNPSKIAGAIGMTMGIQYGVDKFLEKDRAKNQELADKALDSLNSVNNLLGGNNDAQNNKGLLS